MDFFVATKNSKKLVELERILSPLGVCLKCERDFDFSLPDVEETGTTFEENALLKARSGAAVTGLATIADDSGLCVDALDGAPGIFSARFAGEPTDNAKNNEKLLRLLQDVPEDKRTARFVCCVACVFPDGTSFTVRGQCEGKIAFSLSGNHGFGYDPLFLSELGCFGELSNEEKDSISHRGKALRLLYEKLSKMLKED